MQRDGFGNETAYQYTLDGQIREAKRGKRGNSPYKVLQSYEYNDRDQITGITDGNGERIDYCLDSWGRITGVGFSDGVTEGYEYTPSGQVSRTINGNGGSIQYRYNSLGKVRERINQTGDMETFRYDEEGNLFLHIDRDGRRVSRTYNVFGNLVCEKAVDENGENPVVTTCRYDSLGRLTHAVCNGHSYEYIYNDQGRLKEKRSGGRRLISYTYDRAGKIKEMTDPAGVTTHYEYDILGRTSRISSPGMMYADSFWKKTGRMQCSATAMMQLETGSEKKRQEKIRRSGQSIPTMKRTSSSTRKRSGQTESAEEIPLPTADREVY